MPSIPWRKYCRLTTEYDLDLSVEWLARYDHKKPADGYVPDRKVHLWDCSLQSTDCSCSGVQFFPKAIRSCPDDPCNPRRLHSCLDCQSANLGSGHQEQYANRVWCKSGTCHTIIFTVNFIDLVLCSKLGIPSQRLDQDA